MHLVLQPVEIDADSAKRQNSQKTSTTKTTSWNSRTIKDSIRRKHFAKSYQTVKRATADGKPVVTMVDEMSDWKGPHGAGISARKIVLNNQFTNAQPLSLDDRIHLQLTDDLAINASVKTSFSNVNETISTTAHIENAPNGRVFLAATNGIVKGRIRLPNEHRIFSIEYNHDDRSHYLLELDPSLAEPDRCDTCNPVVSNQSIPEGHTPLRATAKTTHQCGKSCGTCSQFVSIGGSPTQKNTGIGELAYTSAKNLQFKPEYNYNFGDEGGEEEGGAPLISLGDESSDEWAVIDVMIAYTDDARVAAGSVEAMQNTIALGAAFANEAYQNSNVYIYWNVIHSYEIAYTETGDNGTDLGYISSDPNVATNRDTYGADFVQFITAQGSGGRGNLLTSSDGNSTRVFSVVGDGSYAGYTPVHEIGHNMGLSHAPDQNFQAGPTNWFIDNEGFGNSAAGHHWHPGGDHDVDGWCSVMAYTGAQYYDGQSGSHVRVGHFSAPEITDENGYATGVVGTANNANVQRTLRHTYAAYRSRNIGNNVIQVVSPNGGEQIIAGSVYNINWDSRDVTGNVRIELYKGGVFDRVIASNTLNDHIYSWTAPTDLSGFDYTIRVSNLANTISDLSDADFNVSSVFYDEPLNNNPGYTITGSNYNWAFGVPSGNNQPAAAYTGTNIYDTVLNNSAWGNGSDQSVTTTAINCTGYSNVALQFAGAFRTTGTARVLVSNNNTDWTELYSDSGIYGSWQLYNYDISAVADNQSTVYIRWVHNSSGSQYSGGGMGIDDIKLSGVQSNTPVIAIENPILSPSCFTGASPADQTFKISNPGSGTLNYTISDNQSWLSVSPASGSSTGEKDTITVTYDASALAAGTYNATITVTDPAATPSSRQIPVTLTVNALPANLATLPYTEAFDDEIDVFWTQGSGDDGDWTRRNLGTPSSGTGPSGGAGAGGLTDYYMFTEASTNGSPGSPSKNAYLDCWVNLRNYASASANFSYHMLGSTMGSLTFLVSEDSGLTWTSAWNTSGDQGNSWQTANVDLTPHVGKIVLLRIRGITGSGYESDMAIDQIALTGVENVDPDGDSDNDGFADVLELAVGTNPNDNGDAPSSLYQGLYAWWQLNETAGTVAEDVSGNSRDGNLTGGASWGTGKHDGAIHVNGVSGKVTYPMAQTTLPAYTVSLWVKASTVNTTEYSGLFNNDSSGSDMQLDTDGGNPGQYRLNASGASNIGTVTTDWMHIVAAFNGTDTKLYRDGELITTVSGNKGNVFGQLEIGVNRAGALFFSGAIDDMMVWERALSAAEVAQLTYLNSVYGTWANTNIPAGQNSLKTADLDNDGLSNELEFALGTDPTVRNENPVTLDMTGAKLKASISKNAAAAGSYTYVIQRSTNLTDWTTTGTTVLTDTDSLLEIESDANISSVDREFYRIMITPL